MTQAKNTICLWYDGDVEAAARFYAETFPDSRVDAVHKAPGDFPGGEKGQVLTVDFTVLGIPCMGLNGGPAFKHTEAFSFQVATVDQEETDRERIVSGLGQVAKGREAARALRHLLPRRIEKVLRVKPEPREGLVIRGLRLRDLVLVVREHEVNAAGVDVERLAQVALAHRRAFDVPSRPARAEWCIP